MEELFNQLKNIQEMERHTYLAGYKKGREDEKKEQEQKLFEMEQTALSNLEK